MTSCLGSGEPGTSGWVSGDGAMSDWFTGERETSFWNSNELGTSDWFTGERGTSSGLDFGERVTSDGDSG